MTQHRLSDVAISASGFIFDPASGSTFTANKTGLEILQGLRDGLDEEAILERLREVFDVGEADLRRDVAEFVHLLRHHHLLDAGDVR